MAEELGVETTETPKSENHRSELLLGAADVGPVGVGELMGMGKQQYGCKLNPPSHLSSFESGCKLNQGFLIQSLETQIEKRPWETISVSSGRYPDTEELFFLGY
ncbi:hypothetical protein FH972_015977 [Carpinus fangiana]|uniref:Uncharacterized protein n=1 Tax=Carpinus fangiana TaxID=176857 RepID=A0A5N6RHR1_9ROSI|nr:hypothetical protein FH972_015977 [Carpinus fangiana]